MWFYRPNLGEDNGFIDLDFLSREEFDALYDEIMNCKKVLHGWKDVGK